MERNPRSTSRRGTAWHHVFVVPLVLLMLANGGPARAGSDEAALEWAEAYAGGFGGLGRMVNGIVDVDGFANWGNPGSVSNYDATGFVGGVLMGKKVDIEGVPLRIEFDSTFGAMSARTNKLDPEGLDETAAAEFRWVTTVRAGIEHAIEGATVFATGGLATAGIANSVTDIDFGPNMPPKVDLDDSFRDNSAGIGWVIGGGVETPLTDAWSLRFEGSYLDFGRGTHYVNRSGNNRCGPGNSRRPCPYNVDNTIGIVRWAIIYQFDR